MNKFSKFFFCSGLFLFLFPTALVSAEPTEDVPTSESTITSLSESILPKSEPTAESVSLSDAMVEDSSRELVETKESKEVISEKDSTAESITPQAEGDVLIEGLPGEGTYDVDKNFADAIRKYSKGSSKPAPSPLTKTYMKTLTSLDVSGEGLASLKGLEFATNLWYLFCANNMLTSIDVSSCPKLYTLSCENNQLEGSLNIGSNPNLVDLNCYNNKITDFGNEKLFRFSYLVCGKNQLTNLDLGACTAMLVLRCGDNPLTGLDLKDCIGLAELDCSNLPQLKDIDVSACQNLEKFYCRDNNLKALDFKGFFKLKKLVEFDCSNNQLSTLDLSTCEALERLYCENNDLTQITFDSRKKITLLSMNNNKMTKLDMSSFSSLVKLLCSNNQLSSLNLSSCTSLTELDCSNNQLGSLNLTGCTSLSDLTCKTNQLTSIDVSTSKNLVKLDCSSNRLNDITSAKNLNQLTTLNASSQSVHAPRPLITNKQAVVDVLRTTAHAGLTATNGTISPVPNFSSNGDKILISNLTTSSLNGKTINFSYNGAKLAEGASSGVKSFNGTISFFDISELNSELKPKQRRVYSGEQVEWSWIIKGAAPIKSEEIRASLNVPAGLKIDTSSIKKNGLPASINDINGTNSLGELADGRNITFTFKTTATGTVEEKLTVVGRVDWNDGTPGGPYFKESTDEVRILDDQQSYMPKEDKSLALVSTPFFFNYGVQDIHSSMKTYFLDTTRYQTNTSVKTKGFYTRMKDDRASNTGWKLTASLSEFTDIYGRKMPNSTGASINFTGLSAEGVVNRDTSLEAIDPSLTGKPSTVKTNETLIVGQSAKTLLSAKAGEGAGTWQLRIPFNNVSLKLPANAGKKNTVYNAKLTWSLDDTP